jgi:hypothetical protein
MAMNNMNSFSFTQAPQSAFAHPPLASTLPLLNQGTPPSPDFYALNTGLAPVVDSTAFNYAPTTLPVDGYASLGVSPPFYNASSSGMPPAQHLPVAQKIVPAAKAIAPAQPATKEEDHTVRNVAIGAAALTTVGLLLWKHKDVGEFLGKTFSFLKREGDELASNPARELELDNVTKPVAEVAQQPPPAPRPRGGGGGSGSGGGGGNSFSNLEAPAGPAARVVTQAVEVTAEELTKLGTDLKTHFDLDLSDEALTQMATAIKRGDFRLYNGPHPEHSFQWGGANEDVIYSLQHLDGLFQNRDGKKRFFESMIPDMVPQLKSYKDKETLVHKFFEIEGDAISGFGPDQVHLELGSMMKQQYAKNPERYGTAEAKRAILSAHEAHLDHVFKTAGLKGVTPEQKEKIFEQLRHSHIFSPNLISVKGSQKALSEVERRALIAEKLTELSIPQPPNSKEVENAIIKGVDYYRHTGGNPAEMLNYLDESIKSWPKTLTFPTSLKDLRTSLAKEVIPLRREHFKTLADKDPNGLVQAIEGNKGLAKVLDKLPKNSEGEVPSPQAIREMLLGSTPQAPPQRGIRQRIRNGLNSLLRITPTPSEMPAVSFAGDLEQGVFPYFKALARTQNPDMDLLTHSYRVLEQLPEAGLNALQKEQVQNLRLNTLLKLLSQGEKVDPKYEAFYAPKLRKLIQDFTQITVKAPDQPSHALLQRVNADLYQHLKETGASFDPTEIKISIDSFLRGNKISQYSSEEKQIIISYLWNKMAKVPHKYPELQSTVWSNTNLQELLQEST